MHAANKATFSGEITWYGNSAGSHGGERRDDTANAVSIMLSVRDTGSIIVHVYILRRPTSGTVANRKVSFVRIRDFDSRQANFF